MANQININSLTLANGITTLGRSEKTDCTGFTYYWAKHLAQKYKVLYVNFKDDQTDFVTLENETTFVKEYLFSEKNYYGSFTAQLFIELLSTIDTEKIKVLFIDDISGGFLESRNNFCPDLAAFVNVLLFVSRQFNVKVVFALNAPFHFRLEPKVMLPALKTFCFPRLLINQSDQVYHFYRSDELENDSDKKSFPFELPNFELFDLKNKDKINRTLQFNKEIQEIVKSAKLEQVFNYY